MRVIKRGERGIALFLALFALLLLSSVALGLMFMANTETAVNTNYKGTTQAFFAAQAGTQEGVMRLRQSNDGWQITPPSAMPSTSATTGVTYIINPTASETVKPWDSANPFFDLELCNESFVDGSGSNLLGLTPAGYGLKCGTAPSGTYYTSLASKDPNTGTNTAMAYKWVRITQKQNATFAPYTVSASAANAKVCWDGAREQTPPIGTGATDYKDCDQPPPSGGTVMSTVYVVTSLAVTPNNSRRMYQVEYAPTPPPTVNAAVASKAQINLTGNLTVNGYDQCTCETQTSGVGANQVTTYNNDRGTATCDQSKYALFSGGDVDPPSSGTSETVVGGQSPAYVGNQAFPSSLDAAALIESLKPGSVDAAHLGNNNQWELNGGAEPLGEVPATLPVADPQNVSFNSQVSYIGGDIHLTGGGGSGVLLVNGDLQLSGGFMWYGLIIATGVVSFEGGGATSTNIQGAVIAGEDLALNTNQNATTLGGSVEINLDVCAVRNSFKKQPLKYISSRELLY